MSCCNSMQVIIQNNAGPNVVARITGIAPGGSTTIAGFQIGDTIANGGSLTGSAQSGSGSRGEAYGTVQVQMLAGGATSGPVQTLQYKGTPKDRFGKCPCTPQPAAQSSGSYRVTTFFQQGEKNACTQTFDITTSSADIDGADWMAAMAEEIGPLPLSGVALPGTHDSATYGITWKSKFSPDKPPWLEIFDGWGPVSDTVRAITAGWARTQGPDIAQQLADGIRYFDLRVCEDGGNGEIWICHGLYSVKVDEVLSQAAAFVQAHPQEIVILDFNHFYAMSSGACSTLASQITSAFGSKLVPVSRDAETTVQELWDAGQQVVVFLDGWQRSCGGSNGEAEQDTPCTCAGFWSQERIRSCWPDAQSLGELQGYLAAEVAAGPPPQGLWVLQGILTEDAQIVIDGLNPFGNSPGTMEQWAASTTPAVVGWIRDQWSNSGLNIVIVDWYQGTGYVETVIGLNQGRAAVRRPSAR